MQPSFAKKLGFHICKINVGVQKIDSNRPETYEMVITLFEIDDKDWKFYFFEEKLSY